MGYGFVYDGPPTRCAKGPRPGTKALSVGVMERFGCGTDGIFNCRPTRNSGSTTLSFHADGRAWDAKSTGELNRRIAAWLVQWADELGVQEVISYRRRWDARTRQWRVYNGDDPHTGHVHVSQCIRAANSLTLATVRAIESGAPGPLAKPTPQEDDDMEIFEITDGPDKGQLWFYDANGYKHIPSPTLYMEMVRNLPGRGLEKSTKIDNAVVWAFMRAKG